MTEKQLEAILNEVFRVIMPKHRKRMEKRDGKEQATD